MKARMGRALKTHNRLHAMACLGVVCLLSGASPASAQIAQAPSLGAAAPFTVLGLNGTPTVGTVTCTNTGPGSTINGDVGTTFNGGITNTLCTITGAIVSPVAGGVVTDFNAALSAIDTQNPVCTGVIPTVSTTLAPGVYCSAAGPRSVPASFLRSAGSLPTSGYSGSGPAGWAPSR